MIVRRTYPVTLTLIGLNVAMFAWEFLKIGPSLFDGSVGAYAFESVGSLAPLDVTANHEYWRIISSGFVHLSLIHIGVNMFSLWFLGRFVEEIAGSWRMALIYAVSLVVSGIGVVYFSVPNSTSAGASGAIFGLFGALFAIGFKFGKPGMALIRANIGILVLNLVFTFFVPGISKAAHVAGLLAGFIFTYAIFFPPKPVRARVVDASSGEELEAEIQSPNAPPYGR